ncbi:hypothetical protein GCM10009830_37550 [Glycomyces endophyticus]|uniref:Uncharacterized protein n=1 Tax=Glycomyces endophyticus TaxID=480996 RepID=A0ABN2HEE9_9ACTN
MHVHGLQLPAAGRLQGERPAVLHVRERDRGGAVRVRPHQRVQELGVLLALADGVALDREVEQPPHPRLEGLHDLREERVPRGGHEFAVERGVRLGARLGVGAGDHALLEPAQVRGPGVGGGEARRDRFEARAHVEQVRDVLRGGDGDDAALAGDRGDEPVGGEPLERLAQRDAGDLELGGEVALDEARARAQPDGDDALAKRPVDLLGSAHVAPSRPRWTEARPRYTVDVNGIPLIGGPVGKGSTHDRPAAARRPALGP